MPEVKSFERRFCLGWRTFDREKIHLFIVKSWNSRDGLEEDGKTKSLSSYLPHKDFNVRMVLWPEYLFIFTRHGSKSSQESYKRNKENKKQKLHILRNFKCKPSAHMERLPNAERREVQEDERCPSLQFPGTLSKRSQTKNKIRKLNVQKLGKR